MQQVKDASRVDLKNVTMKIYGKDGQTYDLVKSAAATFNTNEKSLYSEGAVEITINLPKEGQPTKPPTVIKTSGLTCDSESGRVDTDQPSSFVFEKGDGKAKGATYDPGNHELLMKSEVEIHWNPPGAHAKPMKIEAITLAWHETTSEIWLKPWGRMTRETMVMDGNDVVVKLEDKVIRSITAVNAHGIDELPTRKLRYAADELAMDFDDDGLARKINGNRNASLVSFTDASETTVTADRVDLDLLPNGNESLLNQVTANGHAVVTSKPVAAPARQLSETHVLRSESLEMKMQPGGREMQSVVTKAPGTLEFLPNLPSQHHRVLEGSDFVIAYGPQNRLDNFRATNVKTRTDPTADERRRNRPPSTTTSRELEARFDPKTSHLANMQQSGDFAYEEGDRKARAAKATMDSDQNVILLDTGARMWDPTGSTTADRIRLDQRTGDFLAEGNVASSRLPDKDQKKNSEMLSGDDPLQATARKMDSRNRNRQIRYEGAVHMWQGANRIQADVVDVDRNRRSAEAHPGGRRSRRHQSVGRAQGRKEEEDRHPGTHRSARRAHGLYRVHPPHPLHRRSPVEPPRPAGEGAGTARLPRRERRRFAPGKSVYRWRRRDLLHRQGPHPQRHRRARRVLHRHAEGHPDRSPGAHGGEGVRQSAAQHDGGQGSRLLCQR